MRTIFKVILAFLTLSSFALAADKIKVGSVPGAYGDSIEAAAKEAKKYGIEVEVVEFTDWTTINVATDKGDIDLNYYQHEPFLNNAIEKNGYKLTPIGWGVLSNIGLYSAKHKTFDTIPDKGVVAIANDPVNQGRGLLLLQKAGLIKLKDGGHDKSTLDDITDNPKKLRFTEVEGVQLVRTISEVDLALSYPHFIVAAGTFDPSSGLIWGGIEDKKYTIRFVVPTAKKDDPILRKFVEIYQNSPTVIEVIKKGFNNDPRLYTLTWQNQ
ncbi:MAG: MetQ/NlpA family ABC transporter substrate-binding protein [Campylobacteraceae bacterium]|nr:MetQ/NlpA family ABC transporter substrate-binding protein [Campylobacteraceae bacterium]